jgi:hypothetical protein
VLLADSFQGAAVAAAYIARCLQKDQSHPFRFGVFICAALIPPQTATAKELVRTIGSLGDIDIPTMHIVGEYDPCREQSMQLVKSCESTIAHTLAFRGGHDVPRDDINCNTIAAGIERCARLAYTRNF